jgi:resuscitation-promoting factor RpfA
MLRKSSGGVVVIRRLLLQATTAAGLGGAVVALRWATTPAVAAVRTGAADFDDLVGLAAAIACWLLVGWVALVLAVTALGSLGGGIGRLAKGAAARLTPVAWRNAARLALGLVIAAGPATVATAANAGPAATAVDSSSTDAEVLLLPAVGRPGWSESTNVHRAGTETRPVRAATVVVRPGDCLWSIAASSLGAGASTAEIAAEWPRWYAANRRVIGSDPNLILPGTVLTAPAAR